ncbi:GNAT family N-acetyltransferase [Paraburkholderia phosphatilytica]|uniref:GNAT family N-acetyltransferase n=1 Tax=Paraburkholderia phosphatilytica TaxID=2282883 RepID=UPI000E529149|nr:GNAT family N-acetyltransferase [Paraburkholderia phosphatilytica]
MPAHLTLHPPAQPDAAWLFDTYRDCMREYVEPEYGWDEARQRNGLTNSLTQGVWRILLLDDVRCGFVHWENTPEDITLKLICIAPAMQRKRIGSAVLDRLENHARTSGKPLCLKALATNQIAYSWYRRRGFVEIQRDAHTRTLIYHV